MRDNSLAQALAMAAQLGFSIAVPMLVFIGGGAWLDSTLGTKPWLLFLGILLGVLAAGGALFRLSSLSSSRKPPSGTTRVSRKLEDLNDISGTNRADNSDHDGL